MSDEKVISIENKLIKDVRELRVFERAYDLSLELHKISLTFPKIEQYALADQLRRSSKSVCSNIAEGFAKQHYSSKEFARFIVMAEGSAVEVQIWLQYAFDLGYVASDQFGQWSEDCLAIKSMLFNFRKKL